MATHTLPKPAGRTPQGRVSGMTSRTLLWFSMLLLLFGGILSAAAMLGASFGWRGFDDPGQQSARIWPYIWAGMVGMFASFILSQHEKKLRELETLVLELKEREIAGGE